MKKLLYVVVLLVVFLLGISFHVQNPQTVAINYSYLNWQAELPLSAVLLVVLAIGAVLGYFASLLKSLKLRRNLSKANKTITSLENQV